MRTSNGSTSRRLSTLVDLTLQGFRLMRASRLLPRDPTVHTWPRPPLRWRGIPPTREGSPSAVTPCIAHRLDIMTSDGSADPRGNTRVS
jgi:hypothetical protein